MDDRKLTTAEAAAETARVVVIEDDEDEGGGGAGAGRVPRMTLARMMRYHHLLRLAEEYKAKAAAAPPSDAYKALALSHLRTSFPGLAVEVAAQTLAAHNFGYFKAREELRAALYGELLHPDKLAQRGRMTRAEWGLLMTESLAKRGWLAAGGGGGGGACMETVDLTLEDAAFERERKFVAQFDAMERYEMERAVAEARLLEEEESGWLTECGCCFGDFVFEALVQCSEGHLFCRPCLRRFAQTRVFEEQRAALPCMHCVTSTLATPAKEGGGGACAGEFLEHQLLQVLSPKVYFKYGELQALEAVRGADLHGLVSCPHCAFRGVLDDDGGGGGGGGGAGAARVLACPECGRASCLSCGQDAHPDGPCAETDVDTERRRRVEEAMTAAKVRTCANPKCRKEYVKGDGCNFVRCTACKAGNCYVCRQRIRDHSHFCSKPLCDHTSCGRCCMYTPDEDEAEAAVVKRAGQQANTETDGAGRAVDVDALMKVPPPAPRTGKRKR